jgi:hypothetical protein
VFAHHLTLFLSVLSVWSGYLFKQGSRSRQFWHERYFLFTADGTLKYYTHNPEAEFISAAGSADKLLEPKGVYEVPKLPDCNVSDLYVAKHHKKVIYCIKLSWSADTQTESSIGSYFQDDNLSWASDINHANSPDQSSPIRNKNAERTTKSPEQNREQSILASQQQSSYSTSVSVRKKLGTPFKRQKQHTPKQSSRRVIAAKSNSNGSLHGDNGDGVPTTRSRHRQSKSDGNLLRRLVLSPLEEEVDDRMLQSVPRLEIPLTVEWDDGETRNTTVHESKTKTSRNVDRLKLQREATAASAKEEQEYLQQQYVTTQKEAKRKNRKLMVQGGQLAVATGAAIGLTIVTAGVGLVAGLALLGAGAVAGGGVAGVGSAWKKKIVGEIVIAGEDFDTMNMWKACLDASRESAAIKESRWGQLFVSDGRKPALLPQILDLSYPSGFWGKRDDRVTRMEQNVSWRPIEGGWAPFFGMGTHGLRIFREENDATQVREGTWQLFSLFSKRAAEQPPCAPVKAQLVLNASPLDAFLCLMSYGRMTLESSRKLLPKPEQCSSFRVVQTLDEHSDIIHLLFRPMFLFPSWTLPRDYCMFRYWRLEQDGSYIICYESMPHPMCPPVAGYVRGEMHQVVTIAPQKKVYRRKFNNAPQDCFMTTVAQVDPKGWVPLQSHQAYGETFGVAALLHMIDIRDALDRERYLPVNLEDADRETHSNSYKQDIFSREVLRNHSSDSFGGDDTAAGGSDYDFSYCRRESCIAKKAESYIATHPPATPSAKWAEPDPNSFRVRGPTYLVDRQKINAGPSIGRLICADVVTVDEPIYSGMSIHPNERIQLALKREMDMLKKGKDSPMPPFVFVVNIVLPGPPFYHGVFYYAIDDMSEIDGTSGTGSSKLFNKFFFGESDEFRDKTFKMIPQIVEGNFLVKKAVGSTPAIMGKKLRQLYVLDKDRRFFEVILDCGSSQVATGVIRLSLGYAASLVVDMGFLFEADDASTLPERLFGAVRMKHPEFSASLRKVAPVAATGL